MNANALLDLIRTRASVRDFQDRSVPRETLTRILEAATRAPSPTNRQPWRFSVVTSHTVRAQIVAATRASIEEVRAVLAKGPHGDHLADYWGYFVHPVEQARAFVVVSYKVAQDTIAHLVQDAGADPKAFCTIDQWHTELCAASAATMLLLLQAHAEGLGGCWMSGPMLARERICELLRIKPPWRMLGGVALGWPAQPPVPTTRKALEKVTEWFEETPG